MPMRLKTSVFDVEVKYKKAGNELLVPMPEIRMRSVDRKPVEKVRVVVLKRFQRQGKNLASETKYVDPDTQQQVPSSEVIEILDNFKYKYLDENGAELKEVDVLYFAVQPDGSEKECSPFPRTSLIEIPDECWVPSTSIDEFLITNVYEIFSDDEKTALQLFAEAEKRLKADQIGLTTFSWGGFKQYYVFLVPIFKDGKFVWLLKFTDQKLSLNHLQEPVISAKVPIREAPTLQTLPPVQALVVVVKKKQNK